MHADVKIEDIQFDEVELEVLHRIEHGPLPLETPFSDGHRRAVRTLLKYGVLSEGTEVNMKGSYPRGVRPVIIHTDGRCTPDKEVERYLELRRKEREKAAKKARKREERKRRCDAVLAILPSFVRKPLLKLGHLVIAVWRYLYFY